MTLAWYLKFIGDNAGDVVVVLSDDVDHELLSQQLVAAGPDEIVRVPARMSDQIRETPLYVRPHRWAAWQVFHHDDEVIE